MTSLCINSIAVGIALDLIMRGTVSIASFKVLNGISKLIAFLGRGSNFNVAFVIKPKVPSEPIIRSFKEYPELFFTTFPPNSTIFPFGRTTSRPLT